MNLVSLATLLVSTASLVSAKIHFQENFDDDSWKQTWRPPKQTSLDLGKVDVSSGKFFADEQINRGLKTLSNMKFYALTAPFENAVSNRDGDLVVQFSVKHEQGLNCGGGYIKLLSSKVDVDNFSGQTPYEIMFGPDKCGTSNRVHVILNRGGQGRMLKRKISFPDDEMTHMYTLVLSNPAQTYRVLIDGEEVAAGSIVDDVEDMSEVPRLIPDPEATKPADWDEREKIVDPEDTKPEDWDAKYPRMIPDATAEQPADWNEAANGVWTAPLVKNPGFREWSPREIDNSAYKGKWSAPIIQNPEYKTDASLAVYDSLAHVAFDLWQVKAGSIFDNILVTDDFSVAEKQIETLYKALRDAEFAAERRHFRSLHPEAAAEAEKLAAQEAEGGEADQGSASDAAAHDGDHTDL